MNKLSNFMLDVTQVNDLILLFALIISALILCFLIIIYIIHEYYKKKFKILSEIDMNTKTYNIKGFVKKVASKNKIKRWIIICFDIDNFQSIIENYKFSKNDSLLRTISNNFLDILHNEAIIANTEYDRFLLAIPYKNSIDLKKFLKNLNTKNQKVIVGKINFDVTYTMGVFITHKETISQSIDNAITAWMYAKKNEKDIIIYNTDVITSNQQKLTIVNDYEKAINENRLRVIYTPVLNAKNGMIYQSRVNYSYQLIDGKTDIKEGMLLDTLEERKVLNDFNLIILRKVAYDLVKQKNFVKALVPSTIKMRISMFSDNDYITKMNNVIYNTGISTDLIVIEFPMYDIKNPRFNEIITSLKNNGYLVSINNILDEKINFDDLIRLDINSITLNKNVINDNMTKQTTIKLINGFVNLFEYCMPIIKGVNNTVVLEKLFNLDKTVYVTGDCFSRRMAIDEYLTYLSHMPYDFFSNKNNEEKVQLEEKNKEEKIEEKPVIQSESIIKEIPEMIQKSEIEEIVKDVLSKHEFNNKKEPEEVKTVFVERVPTQEPIKQENREVNLAEVLANTLNSFNPNNQIDDFLTNQPVNENIFAEEPDSNELNKTEKSVSKKKNVVVEKEVDEEEEDDDDDEIESEEVSNAISSKFDKIMNVDKFNELLSSYVEKYNSTEPKAKISKTLLQNLSFVERIDQSSKEIKSYYNMIKNKILSYDGMTNSVTKKYDIFRLGKVAHIKLTYVGITLKMYINLNPGSYPYGQFPHKDVSHIKKYEVTPYLMKIRSNLGLKRAIILITDLMVNLQLKEKPKYKNLDFVALNQLAIEKLNSEN